jgi:hypothetical protein
VREEVELECVMRLRGSWKVGEDWAIRIAEKDELGGSLRRVVSWGDLSSVCEDRWAAIGPQTSGNSETLPVTNG